jgi:hypothetical protein
MCVDVTVDDCVDECVDGRVGVSMCNDIVLLDVLMC